MSKRKHPRSRIENPDPEKAVEPCPHIPGSVQKVEALKDRYQNHELLHVEGDLLDAPNEQIEQAKAPRKDGLNFPTGKVVKVEGAGGPERTQARTLVSTKKRLPVGALERTCHAGQIVHDYRLTHKLTLYEMAEQIGLTRGHLRDIEKNARFNIGIYTLWMLADFLGMSLDDLIGRYQPPNKPLKISR